MSHLQWNPEQAKAIQYGQLKRSFCMIGAAGTGKTNNSQGHVVYDVGNSQHPNSAIIISSSVFWHSRYCVGFLYARGLSETLLGKCQIK